MANFCACYAGLLQLIPVSNKIHGHIKTSSDVALSSRITFLSSPPEVVVRCGFRLKSSVVD